MSTDGGRTWSPTIKVNQTPTTEPNDDQQAFTPAVDVASDGTVTVSYYDFRHNTASPASLDTDYFAVHCHAGCGESEQAVDAAARTTVRIPASRPCGHQSRCRCRTAQAADLRARLLC